MLLRVSSKGMLPFLAVLGRPPCPLPNTMFGVWGSGCRVHTTQALWFMRKEAKSIDQPARTLQAQALRPDVRAVRGQ